MMSILFLVLFMPSYGQSDTASVDTSEVYIPKYQKTKRRKLVFELDGRTTLIQGEWLRLGGFRIGMEYREKFRLGLASHYVQSPVPLRNNSGFKSMHRGEFNFRYNSIFYDYIILHNFRYAVEFSAELGGGKANFFLYNHETDDLDTTITSTKLSNMSLKIAGYVNATPWFAIGTGVGFTTAKAVFPKHEVGLNAPFYTIKLKFMLGRLFKTIFKPEIIEEERFLYEREKQKRIEERQKQN